MAFKPSTARRCSGVMLSVAMAALFSACSGSGTAEGESVARRAGEDGTEAPVQPATAPDAGASAATAPAARAPDPASTGAAGAAAGTTEGATVGGDGSEIALAPLSTTDIDGAALTGELVCSFSIGDAAPLLLAVGNVASEDPSHGVVKVGDYVEAVATPGGFDAMLQGAQFSGAGKTIRIVLTGPATGAGESPPAPATLTYDRADGARRSYVGQWQCGP
jgi:hypothetical protein